MKIRYLVIIGIILLIVGSGIAFIGFWRADFKISALENEDYYVKELSLDITDDIKIEMTSNNIKILVSEDVTQMHIKYYESEYTKYEITTENDLVLIKQNTENKPWYKYVFNFNFHSYKTEITVPKQIYNSINIKGTTGNIEIKDIEVVDLKINLTTGNFNLDNVVASNELIITATTGNVDIDNTVVAKTNITLTTGNLYVDDANLGDVYIKCTTGNMRIVNCIFSKVIAESTTGNIRFTNLTCDDIYAKATTGNLTINIAGKLNDYKVSVDRTTGNSNISNKSDGEKSLTVIVRTGNIRVSFTE